MNDLPILQRKDGTVRVEDNVRDMLRQAMKESGKPREQIAREMSEALGRRVTASMLADFSRNGTKKRQVRFPAAWVPVLCEATGCDDLRFFLLGQELRKTFDLGERVTNMRWALDKARTELAKLNGQEHRSKPKNK